MAMIQFLRGTQAGLAAKETINGALYFTTDTHKIYMGTETGKQEFSAIEVVSNMSALPAVDTAIKGKFYYAESENVFCFPFNGAWKQVNPDTGATSIEVAGTGNAVTAATYDPASRKITLTKGETFAKAADVASKIGEVGEGSVKDYVDGKVTEINSANNALAGRVTTLEGKVDVDKVSTAISDAKAAVLGQADYTGTVKGAYEAAAAAQATANSKTTMAEVEAKNYATKTEAQGYANAKDAAIAAAKKAGDDAQAAVDALSDKVGTVADGSTVVGMINAMDAAYKAADTDLSGRIATIEGDYLKAADKTALQNQINTLVGEDTGKSARAISAEEVAKVVAGADASFDTLKEIADWISSHKTDATAMNSAIVKLEAIVDGIGGDGEKATVVAYVTDAIAALKIGDYAKAADLTALAARVEALEGTSHTHSNKALLDTYTQTEADLADAVAKKHDHTFNETELNKIAEGDVAKWNAAESNAKSYADGIVADEKTRAEAAEQANAKAISDEVTRAKAAEKVNSDAIAVINGDATTEGSFAKADATLKTQLEAYADQAETDAVATAKAYTNSCLEWGSF